jgi:cell shape-determining protein MreC
MDDTMSLIAEYYRLKRENEELKKKLAEIGEIASKLLELPIFKESK